MKSTVTLESRSRKVIRQRIRAIQRTLSPKKLGVHLGENMNTRYCKRVPADIAIWFTVGIGMFSADAYCQIFRWLAPLGSSIPGSSTLTEVRKRIGVELMTKVYLAVVNLLGTVRNGIGFYQGMRLMGVDGFTLDLFDSPENRRAFGRPRNNRTRGPFPQARCVALAELGTHVIWRTAIGGYWQGETTLFRKLFGYLQKQMLVLMDRNFLSFEIVDAITSRKAEFLIRCKRNRNLPIFRRLPDGSYLSRVYPTQYDQQKDRNGIEVRVIEYTLNECRRTGCKELHRLVTSLLDAQAHPAEEMVVLYHSRWEEELAIDELKTHLRSRPVLRSQRPDGVRQEILALLISHYLIRKIAFDASRKAGVPPTRISFTAACRIFQSKLAEVTTIGSVEEWYQLIIAAVANEVIADRDGRINPRVLKKTTSEWTRKRDKHRKPRQPTTTFRDSIVILD